MPNITKVEGIKGTTYKMTAFCGYDKNGKQIRKFKTYTPNDKLTPKQAEKEAFKQAQIFEDSINKGLTAYDGTIKFEEYANRWLDNVPLAPKTKERYVTLLVRINQAIGNMKLEKIQAHHLESFYKNLQEDGISNRGNYATSTKLDKILKDKGIKIVDLAKLCKISTNTITEAKKGNRISIVSAQKIAKGLKKPVEKIFDIVTSTCGLSDKTILHHHRLISGILGKAKKERIIMFNVALEHTTAPKVKRKEAVFLDDITAQKMVELLLCEEDIRVKTSILIMLYSGVRRGELCGLEWQDIDFKNQLIHIKRASQFQKDVGITEVPTKNESSVRAIKMPLFVMDILTQYKKWWYNNKISLGSHWKGEKERLFIQDDGKPINPDTINFWLDGFIARHDLPHFSPHSLRHTFATLQIMAGVNIRTIQARTGHAQASTLVNIYSHAIKSADELATSVLDDILTPKTIKDKQA